MGKRRRRETPHAEGGHGPKTEAHIIEQLESGISQSPRESLLEFDRASAALNGKRRLVEDREQHDEGEKNSEHKRVVEKASEGNR